MRVRVGRVQFIKPVMVPHYNSFEGLTWKDHRHELDMVFEDGWLVIRGMPERLKGRMVEVMVPESNIAGMLTLDAELEWTKEDERRKAEEEARHQRQETRHEERADARSESRSSDESIASESGGKKKASRGGGSKASAGRRKAKGKLI